MKRSDFKREIWSLLRKNVSVGQLLGYAAANIVGLAVILVGIMFFSDSQRSATDDDQFFSDDYIVVSKKVVGIGFTPVSFAPEEIESIKRQKWAVKVGEFTASQFAVNGAINMGGRGLSTYLFFESVPNDFFDVAPRDWHFEPNDTFVPIIMSKDYLALYNFGFAIPQGLPQVSEEIVGAVPITLSITGKDNVTEYFKAAVVGFSSRLNTIAVPQSFMDWANQRYGTGEKKDASRLIVKINRLESANMNKWLEDHNLEVAGDKDKTGNISAFLGVVSRVVAANGAVICALALFILTLSIFLLLQKNRETIRKLTLLGFAPREISRYYEAGVAGANAVITLVALIVAVGCRMTWTAQLHEIGLGGASVLPVVGVALAYLAGVTALNIYIIRKEIAAVS